MRLATPTLALFIALGGTAAAQLKCDLIADLVRFCPHDAGWELDASGDQGKAFASYKRGETLLVVEVEEGGLANGATTDALSDGMQSRIAVILDLPLSSVELKDTFPWYKGNRLLTTKVHTIRLDGDVGYYDLYTSFWVGENGTLLIQAANAGSVRDRAFKRQIISVLEEIEFLK